MIDPGIITRGAEMAQLQQRQNMDALADLGGNLGQLVLGRRINQMQQLKTPEEQQAFAKKSIFAPQLNQQLKADQAAALKAVNDQLKFNAELAKTGAETGKLGSEAFKNNAQGQGYGLDNAGKVGAATQKALSFAAKNGDKNAAFHGLDLALNTGEITPEAHAQARAVLSSLNDESKIKEFAMSMLDPKYNFQTVDNAETNAVSTANNIRTTNASMYSTDKAAETAEKNRAQQKEQFDASLYVQQNKPLDYFTAADGTRYAVYANGMGIPVSNNHGAPIKAQQPSAMNSTVQGAILEADDKLSATTNAITNLKDALKYSAKAYDGFGATQRASVVGNIKDSEEATATAMLNNIVTGNALEMLRATFGGAPTEGERAILLQLQGSANLPRAQREAIYNRAIAMAEARQTSNQQKANNLRSGTYFSQQQGVPYANAGQQNPSGGAKKAQSFFD